MSDDFKQGFIIGSAMQPLHVVQGASETDNFFVKETILITQGFVSDEGFCEYIEVQH